MGSEMCIRDRVLDLIAMSIVAARLTRIGVVIIDPVNVEVRNFLRTHRVTRTSIRRVDLDLVWTPTGRGLGESHHFTIPTIVTADGTSVRLNHFKQRQKNEANQPEVIDFVHSLRQRLGVVD